MNIDPVARRILEDHAEDAATRSGLPPEPRTEARIELYSHLHDLAADRAREEGHDRVEPRHAREAIGALGTPREVDEAFFAGHRAETERGPFLPRSVAYVADIILANMAVWMLAWPILFILAAPFAPFADPGALDCGFEPLSGPECTWHGGATFLMAGLAGLAVLFRYALVAGAFAAFEAYRGQTPGKMVLGLRVTTTEGGTLGWREAILRNVVKPVPPLVLLDTLLGYLAFDEARERLSDRFAGTIVVRESG